MATPENTQLLQIALRGDEDQFPLLLDVTSFLYDFNLLYEFMRMGLDEQYFGYPFSQYSWTRKGRPLRAEDRLRVVRLQHESPIHLVTIAIATPGAVAAAWGILQIVEKITNWPLNRDILKLQRDKLRMDVAAAQVALAAQAKSEVQAEGAKQEEPASLPSENSFRLQLEQREAEYYVNQTANRLERGVVRVKEIKIDIISGSQAEKR
jgi:hypothetical protein